MTNKSNIAVARPAVGGCVFRHPLSGSEVVIPTAAASAFESPWIEQGYIAQQGIERQIEKTFAEIKAFGGDTVAKPRKDLSVGFTFTLIEANNFETAKTVWGDSAVVAIEATAEHGGGSSIAYRGDDLPESAWGFHLAYKGSLRKIVAPLCELATKSFNQAFRDDDIIAYPVELTVYPDADGVYFYELTDDGIKAL